jgi:DNA recombination protein RmuC
MTTVWLLIGLAVGYAAGSLIVRALMRSRIKAVETERDAAVARGDTVVEERDRALSHAHELEKDRDQHLGRCRELAEDKANLRADLAGVRGTLDAEREAHKEKVEALTTVNEETLARMAQAAGAAAEGKTKDVVNLLKAELANEKTEAGADLSKRQKAVEDIVKPLMESVADVNQRMEKFDRERHEETVQLGEQLRALIESEKDLRGETGALTRALRQPQTGGRWGELHLERAVELAGMVGHCDFDRQRHIDDDGTVLRPDLIVTLPQGKSLVVDAKAPVHSYFEACEETDGDAQEARMKLYARGLRAHVKKLAGKRYWTQFEVTPELVLMYLPGEHLLAAAAQVDSELIEDAVRKGVHIVTPTTLMVTLRTVACAWQQERIAEDARAVARDGQVVYDRLVRFLGLFGKLGTVLNRAVGAYNDVAASGTARLVPAAKRLAAHGITDTSKALPAIKPIDQRPREVPNADVVEGSAEEIPVPAEDRAVDEIPANSEQRSGSSEDSGQEAA